MRSIAAPHLWTPGPRAEDIDLHRFETTVGRARELLALDEPERAAYLLGEALDLWRGPALADLDDWDVARDEATRQPYRRVCPDQRATPPPV